MEEDPNTYIALIDAYRGQLEAIEAQSAYIEALIRDYTKAKITLDNLEKYGRGEVLLPIGGGIFVSATCNDVSNFLVSEGADIVIKKDIDKARESLEDKIDDLQNNLTKLGEMYQKIQERIDDLYKNIRKILEKKG